MLPGLLSLFAGLILGGAAMAAPPPPAAPPPTSVDWLQRLGQVDEQVRLGLVNAATKELEFYRLAAPEAYRAMIDLRLASIHANQAAWKSALAEGADAVAHAHGDGWVYLTVARIDEAAGHHAQALALVEQARQDRTPAVQQAISELERQLGAPPSSLPPILPWAMGLVGGALVTAAGLWGWRQARSAPYPAPSQNPLAFGPRFFPPGHVIGNYRILRVIGSTLNSTLYCAEDVKLHRQVALKTVNPGIGSQTDNAMARFQKEVQSLIALSEHHPGVVKVYDYLPPGTLVTEWIEGTTLEEAPSLPIDRILQVGIELCEVLSAAHAHGIVHRDIKPSNVMLVEDTGHVKLLDFGIAKNANLGTSNLTLDSNVPIGTFTYMAPEQFAAPNQAKPVSDTYSLGLTLYRLITGQMPTEPWFGPRTFGILPADQFHAITPESQAIARVLLGDAGSDDREWVAELDACIRKAFAENPAERHQTAAEFGKELSSLWHRLSLAVRA